MVHVVILALEQHPRQIRRQDFCLCEACPVDPVMRGG